MIHIDPDELEREARQIETIRDQFIADLEARQRDIEGLNWEGTCPVAFGELFERLRVKMGEPAELIGNIAALLQDAKDGMIQMDLDLAANMQRNL